MGTTDQDPLATMAESVRARVQADSTLRDAMKLLFAEDAETAVVEEDGEVVGVFSLRRLADHVHRQRFPRGDDPVEDWAAEPAYYKPDEPVEHLIHGLTRSGAVLINEPDGEPAVITLKAIAAFAYPFLIVEAIEISLRAAIAALVPADDRGPLFQDALSRYYGNRPTPNSVDQLTISDYRTVLTHPSMKERTQRVFGGRIGHRLEKIGDIRNELLHFRDAISDSNLEYLEDQRSWLRKRLRRIPELASSPLTRQL